MGNLVPDELRIQIRDTVLLVFRTLFHPLTSTQLGILESVLNMKKQNTLKVSSRRAQEFQRKFLDTFKEKQAEDIATYHRLLTAIDDIDERYPPGDDPQTQSERLYEIRAVRAKGLLLLIDFQEHVDQSRFYAPEEGTLTPRPEGFVKRRLMKNPRLFAEVSFAFNTIGALGALASIILEISDSGSDLYSHNLHQSIPAGIGVAATFLGAIGSWKSSIGFIRSIREQITPNTPNSADVEVIPMQQLNRAADEIPVFERLAPRIYKVDLVTTERVTTRLRKYLIKTGPSVETKLFLGLGVVADFTFLGISLYNIYKDSKEKTLDGWKLADDIGLAVSSTLGAAVGKSVYNSYF